MKKALDVNWIAQELGAVENIRFLPGDGGIVLIKEDTGWLAQLEQPWMAGRAVGLIRAHSAEKTGFTLRQTPAFESSGAVRTPRERPLQTTPSSAFDAGARKTNGCVLLQSFQHCVYAACLSGLRGAGDTAIVRRPWTWKAKSVYLNGLAMPYRTCVFTKRKERDSIHVDC